MSLCYPRSVCPAISFLMICGQGANFHRCFSKKKRKKGVASLGVGFRGLGIFSEFFNTPVFKLLLFRPEGKRLRPCGI